MGLDGMRLERREIGRANVCNILYKRLRRKQTFY